MVADRKIYKVDPNRAKQKKQSLQEESQRKNLPMWKIPVATSRIRILPPWSEAGDIAFECRSHWNIPPNDRMYNCLKVINKECPLCNLANEFRNAGKKNLASRLYATKSIYYNIVVRGEEEKGVQIMRSGVQLYESILSYLYDEDYGDITDIENGRDMIIERVGTGKEDTRYDLKPAAKTSPLHSNKAMVDKFINGMFDLDTDIAEFKDPMEIQGVVDNIHGGGLRDTVVIDEDRNLIDTDTKAIEVKEEVEEEEVTTTEKSEKEKLLAEIESLL
jgi:hypothetical protein